MSNAIVQLERSIVDALVTNPLFPSAVNVLRLADTLDNEGVVQQTSNVVVVYTSSFSNVKNRDPLVVERTLNFELRYTVQSYLSKGAHDFCTELMSASVQILTQTAPCTELLILEPFRLESERFMGITDNSQFQYSQTWRVMVGETYQNISDDPCVRKGNCRFSWPPPNVSPSTDIPVDFPPGGVPDGNGGILLPCPPPGTECNPRTYLFEDDLFLCDGTLLIEDWGLGIYILRVRSQNTDGTWRVEVVEVATGDVLKELQYCDSQYRIASLFLDLWRSGVNKIGVKDFSSLDWVYFKEGQPYRQALIVLPTVFTEIPDADDGQLFSKVADGKFVYVNPDVTMTVDGRNWVRAVIDGDYRGWIIEDDRFQYV